MVVANCNAYRNWRNKIQKDVAWVELLAHIRLELEEHPPLLDRGEQILRHLVQRQCLSSAHALAVRQVLDQSCITPLIGGAGMGNS